MPVAKNTPVLHLDRNENLYGPAPACFEVLKNAGQDLLSVYSRDFLRGVKSGLSERLAKELGVPEERILLSEGSEDMLKQAVHCYLASGEKSAGEHRETWSTRTPAGALVPSGVYFVRADLGGQVFTRRLVVLR